MREEVRDWAPLQAATSDAVRAKLDQAVAAWDARWFPSGRLEASLAATPPAHGDDGDGPWRSHGAAVATRYPRSVAARLVERALGLRFDGLALGAGDRRVISAFSQRMADDLALSIERALGLQRDPDAESGAAEDPWGPLGGLTVAIGEPRRTLLCAAIPLEKLVPACKAALAPPRPATTPLADPRESIGATPVRLDATLGRARLTLAELRALAPGDIVVLDSALTGGIELTLAGAERSIAGAKLGEKQGRLALTLQAHPNRGGHAVTTTD